MIPAAPNASPTTAAALVAKRPMKTPNAKRPRLPRSPRTTPLRLTPHAWAKLSYWRDAGPTEIGGFGIARRADLLLVTDVRLIPQACDWASVRFDDDAVADFFEEEVAQGWQPEEFARIWIHTHPGASAQPSGTDEETFERAFGRCDWAVMFILARDGATYARIRFAAGPGGSVVLPVEVDYGEEFAGSDQSAWQAEYEACVRPAPAPSAFDEPDWGRLRDWERLGFEGLESWDLAEGAPGDFEP